MSRIQSLHTVIARINAADGSIAAWRGDLNEVNQLYREMERTDVDVGDLVRLKLALIGWRKALLGRILAAAQNGTRAADEHWLGLLGALHIHIPDVALQALRPVLTDAENFARLLALQGRRTVGFEHHHLAAGPDQDLPIRPNKGSKWPFSRWSGIPRFSEYPIDDGGVSHRGFRFQPGDVLVTNVNREGNGLYTCLSEPRNFGSHSGFFAVLEGGDGRRYPSVMETFERGVRAIPLSVFVNPAFSSYVEIYRHVDARPEHWDLINEAAYSMIDGVLGYNFFTEDPDPTYLSCTRVGTEMLAAAGLRPVSKRSLVADAAIQANLERLGYTAFTYFAPVDYIRDETLRCVGWLDNNDHFKMLCREWIDQRVRQLFSTRHVDPARFPLTYRVNHWGIGHIQRQTLLGRIIGLAEGFDHATLPRGPREMMALIQVAEGQLGRATNAVYRDLEAPLASTVAFEDVDELGRRPEVREAVDRHLCVPWLV